MENTIITEDNFLCNPELLFTSASAETCEELYDEFIRNASEWDA